MTYGGDSLAEARDLSKDRPLRRRAAILAAVCVSVALVFGVVANTVVLSQARGRIVESATDIPEAVEPEAILILGAGVKKSGAPSNALADRLQTGLDAWSAGIAPIIVVTGANSLESRHQVDVMAQWLESRGVPEDAIIRDPGGVNTYDSMWRARNTYHLTSLVAVSQRFHLARIVYDGEQLGLDVWAIQADRREYSKLWLWTVREWGARAKDLVMGIVKPDAGLIDF